MNISSNSTHRTASHIPEPLINIAKVQLSGRSGGASGYRGSGKGGSKKNSRGKNPGFSVKPKKNKPKKKGSKKNKSKKKGSKKAKLVFKKSFALYYPGQGRKPRKIKFKTLLSKISRQTLLTLLKRGRK